MKIAVGELARFVEGLPVPSDGLLLRQNQNADIGQNLPDVIEPAQAAEPSGRGPPSGQRPCLYKPRAPPLQERIGTPNRWCS